MIARLVSLLAALLVLVSVAAITRSRAIAQDGVKAEIIRLTKAYDAVSISRDRLAHEPKDLPVEEGFVPFRGYKVWYRAIGGTSGKEPPLLVLHGGPGYPHDYLQPLEALATRERKVIFYDQLGCGNSDHSHNPGLPHDPAFWSVDLFVQEVDAVRQALKLDRCSILGQSWGGVLAMQYALTRPRGLVSLVISSSPASMPQFVAEVNRLRQMLPKEVQKTLLEHEKAGTTDSAEYQKAAAVFYKRHLCRLDPYPEYINRVEEKCASGKTGTYRFGTSAMVHTTIVDLCRFGQFFAGCSATGPISSEFKRLALTVPPDTAKVSNFTAGGWIHDNEPTGEWFVHGGSLDGHQTMLMVHPGRKLVIAMYRNSTRGDQPDDGWGDPVTQWAEKRLAGTRG